MTLPRATYRLQLRDGMDFGRAAALAPYLARLGASHLYVSPIFKADPGSTHGYDVVDHGVLDPVLGGEAGWNDLVQALRANGLGLLLDIVPNHMAVSSNNPWWNDVLTWGSRSRWARHFDIDWSADRLLVAILGEPYGEALDAGAIELRLQAEPGRLVLCYHDNTLPLTPPSYAEALNTGSDPRLRDLSRRFAGTTPARGAVSAFRAFGEALAEPSTRQAIEAAIAACNADTERLHDLHEAQHWRLGYWRLAREMLTYRRFFEIADLIGVRVEDAAVFRDVHRRVIAMVENGEVDGLRIDHIDGLADPKRYLRTLANACSAPYVVVEKILMPDETLPSGWATDGTTGYEVGRLLVGLQVDTANADAFTHAWVDFTNEKPDYPEAVRSAKRRIVTANLTGELRALTTLARRIAAADRRTRDLGPDALRAALVELIVEIPVYRSYIDDEGCNSSDARMIAAAGERANRHFVVEDVRPVDFLVGLLTSGIAGEGGSREDFVRRFQQTTGPAMAKSVEDTAFYRFNRLIALNEVGSEPDPFGLTVPEFHAAVVDRSRTQPHGLSATATHDTKRGEDARLRIAVLSQQPGHWRANVERWHAATADLRTDLPTGPAPRRNDEWLFYQSALGAWPSEEAQPSEIAASDLADRLEAFMIKALREAKRHTTWTDPNADYEAATARFVRGVLARTDLVADLDAVFQPLIAAGAVSSLTQLALKLTLPGVPDIYQGTELFDLSLVDPDNRTAVDFDERERTFRELDGMPPERSLDRWRSGLAKFWMLRRLLDLRREEPALFAQGTYEPIVVEGSMANRLVAFTRRHGSLTVLVAAPRLPLGLLRGTTEARLDARLFEDARLVLPSSLGIAEADDLIGGGAVAIADGRLLPASPLERFPVAVLALR